MSSAPHLHQYRVRITAHSCRARGGDRPRGGTGPPVHIGHCGPAPLDERPHLRGLSRHQDAHGRQARTPGRADAVAHQDRAGPGRENGVPGAIRALGLLEPGTGSTTRAVTIRAAAETSGISREKARWSYQSPEIVIER